jgi:hypothetical protein
MSEKKALKNALIKLGIVCIFAILYCLGGMEGFDKVLRRFIAPTILVGGLFYFSRDWKSLIQLPFMFFSLALGYGAVDTIWKIIRRLIFGIANGITSSGYNILQKKWLLVGTQIIFLAGFYIVMGVYNPLPSARVEELLLGFCVAVIPLFSVKENN